MESAAAAKAADRRTAAHLEVMRQARDALLESRTKEQSRRADTEFHLAIAAATGDEVLRANIEEARAQMFLPVDLLHFDFVKSSSHGAHEQILAAIDDRNAEAACRAMGEHLATTREELDRVLGMQRA